LFSIRRADVERFAGEVETTGPARATVTVGPFYEYAVEEEHLDYSPAAHVGRL
jgi:integrase/recombinase XerD